MNENNQASCRGARYVRPYDNPIASYILKVLGNDVLFFKGLNRILKMERH